MLLTNLMHRQSLSPARQFAYYSMEAFFQPRLVATLAPSSSVGIAATPRHSAWTKRAIASHALCGVLFLTSVGLFVNNRALHAEMIVFKSSHSFDDHGNSGELPHRARDAVKTMTITTTVLASDVPRRLPDAQSSATAVTALLGTETTLPPSSASSALPASPTLPSTVPTFTPTPFSSPTDRYALAPFSNLDQMWNLRFDFPQFNIPEATKAAVDAVLDGVGVVWRLFQRVLHYPLDPP